MLTQDYAYTLLKVFIAGIPTLPGILTVLFFLGVFVSLIAFKTFKPGLRPYVFWLSLLASLLLFTVTLYTTTFEFEERPETLEFSGLPDGAPTCGTGWTGWAKSGYGMSNACPKGCYRGLTLRKQLRMSGFPPWPGYRRELQCWNNDD
jgi:hypothetical protein